MVNSLAQVDAEDRLAGRARLLPGHRAVGPQPRRSRQPAAGRLRAARAAARRGRRAARAGAADARRARSPRWSRPGRTAASSCWSPPPGCACAASCPDVFLGGALSAARHRDHRAGRRGRVRADGRRRRERGRALRRAAALRRGWSTANVRPARRRRAGRRHASCCRRSCATGRSGTRSPARRSARRHGVDSAWIFLGEAFETVPVAILRAI